MAIIIPTHGRVNAQLTVQNLPKGKFMKRVTLVCPEQEYNRLRDMRTDYEVVVQPDPTWKITAKREWIIQEWVRRGYEKIFMLDDDLRFATRKSAAGAALIPIADAKLEAEFQRIEDKLSFEFPHVGFAQRQGNNTIKETGWKTPGKMVCTLGYYLPVVAKEVDWSLIELREDMCTTLQLLLKGYPNALWTDTVADQREFSAPGGCSRYRTVEMNNEEARRLAALFPQYITLADRKYQDGSNRVEVVIQWQKALEEGRNARNRG
jgi:hypothetical protein